LDILYNTKLGVVKEYRAIYLPEGINKALFEGVASRIDPTSVRLKAFDSVIEIMVQNLQYDLVSKDKILTKYIDKEGKLQFIGEDSIDPTPKDETLRLFIGQAFDSVGERTQRDYKEYANWYEYEWAVNLRNHKDEDIVVTVIERTGGDWEIIDENYRAYKGV